LLLYRRKTYDLKMIAQAYITVSPNPQLHLITETEPVSETLWFWGGGGRRKLTRSKIIFLVKLHSIVGSIHINYSAVEKLKYCGNFKFKRLIKIPW
jgi:hypothetical protein